MTANQETINTLMVSDRKECASLLRHSLESDGIGGNIHRIDVHSDTLARVRELCRDKSERRPDFVIFDLADPDEDKLALLGELAFGRGRCSIPVVVLTSPETESLLQSGAVDGGGAIMFSSISLDNMIATLRAKRRNRFLRALSVIYAIGPVLVQAPSKLLAQRDGELVRSDRTLSDRTLSDRTPSARAPSARAPSARALSDRTALSA